MLPSDAAGRVHLVGVFHKVRRSFTPGGNPDGSEFVYSSGRLSIDRPVYTVPDDTPGALRAAEGSSPMPH